MEKRTKEILDKDISTFGLYFDNSTCDYGLQMMMGKILLSSQLGLINRENTYLYIDYVFREHQKVKTNI